MPYRERDGDFQVSFDKTRVHVKLNRGKVE